MKFFIKSLAITAFLVSAANAQTAEQQNQIADAMSKSAAAQADAINQANAAMQQAQQQQAEANKQLNAAMSNLTPEQKAQVELEMKKAQERAAVPAKH